MNIWDVLIIIVLAAAVFFAVRHVIRSRKRGCGCGCSDCTKNCAARRVTDEK